MSALLLDGLRAPNAALSRAGWAALVLTTLFVGVAVLLVPGYAGLSPIWQVGIGAAVQGFGTLMLAGLAHRESEG